jgi:hypothetical protein
LFANAAHRDPGDGGSTVGNRGGLRNSTNIEAGCDDRRACVVADGAPPRVTAPVREARHQQIAQNGQNRELTRLDPRRLLWKIHNVSETANRRRKEFNGREG